jgi:ABC-type amino acid transport substrate-binding protein
VTGIDIAQTTIPYYRSTFVLVTRSADGINATSVTDPALRPLAIGAQAGSPAVDALARADMLDHLHAYNMTGDGQPDTVGQHMIEDLAAKRIDAAVIWGPIGGYYAGLQPNMFRVVPLASGAEPSPFAFEIGMAVRFGEMQWRERIEHFIRTNRAAVQEILMAAHVPLLPLLPEKKEQ